MTTTGSRSRFDWSGFERELTAALVERVRSAIAERPDAGYDAAALDHIYRETDGPIMLPYLAVRDAEAAADPDRLWSTADWGDFDDEWLPDERARHWQSALTSYACGGGRRAVHRLPRSCRPTGAAGLPPAGGVPGALPRARRGGRRGAPTGAVVLHNHGRRG